MVQSVEGYNKFLFVIESTEETIREQNDRYSGIDNFSLQFTTLEQLVRHRDEIARRRGALQTQFSQLPQSIIDEMGSEDSIRKLVGFMKALEERYNKLKTAKARLNNGQKLETDVERTYTEVTELLDELEDIVDEVRYSTINKEFAKQLVA